MVLAACVISMLGLLFEKLYASEQDLPYNSSMLVLLSFIASSLLLSCALTVLSKKSKALLWIIPTVSAILIASVHIALKASASDTILSLIFIPSSVTLSLCMLSKCEKAHTVVANAVVIGLAFLLAVLLEHYEIFGEISERSVIITKEYLKETFLSLYSSYDYTALGITLSQLEGAFEITLLLIPSVFLALAATVSYIQATLTRLIVLDKGICGEELTHWPLKMSRLASVIFLLSLTVALIGSAGENSLLMITAINLVLVFVPGFFLIGIRCSGAHFRRPGLFGMIFGVLVIISCLQNPILLFILVSIMGAFDNLFTAFRSRLYGEKKK